MILETPNVAILEPDSLPTTKAKYETEPRNG